METKEMNQQDYIMVQDAKIINPMYSISWRASAYYQEILVCLKSSWMSYDSFVERIKEYKENESSYQANGIYCEKVKRQTSVQILTNLIRTPIDVILLPIDGDTIYVPKDDQICQEIQKTVKRSIKYTQKQTKSCVFSGNIVEEMMIPEEPLPISRETIVAEYIIENSRYPITVEMLGQTIEIQHSKRSKCDIYIAKELNNKYNLQKSEE